MPAIGREAYRSPLRLRRHNRSEGVGREALPRLVAWNGGVLLAGIGRATDLLPFALLGVLAFTAAALLSVGLVTVAFLRRAAVSG